MKCPHCGAWNRAHFPKCFRCGMPLPRPAEPAPNEQDRQAPLPPIQAEPAPQKKIQADHLGQEHVLTDPKDDLAREMRSLQARKRRGQQRDQLFPDTPPLPRPIPMKHAPISELNADHPVDFDECRYNAKLRGEADPQLQGLEGGAVYVEHSVPKQSLRYQETDFSRLRRLILSLCLLLALLAGGYLALDHFVLSKRPAEILDENVRTLRVEASVYQDVPAHTVFIPAANDDPVYIKELRRTYMAENGYYIIPVPDYIWFENFEEDLASGKNLLPESMDVSITPYRRAKDGQQVAMEPIPFTVDIPSSPINLIKPDTQYIETHAPIIVIQFRVANNSQVYIDDQDFSSYVNTQDGLITYNKKINASAVPTNVAIKVKTPFHRMNELKLTIYRPAQDINIDLDQTLGQESNRDTMTIRGSTKAGAAITVLTPHTKLDTSTTAKDGNFSFRAKLEKYGLNTIRIQADYPGLNTTVLEYNVTYMPSANEYTTKAWRLDDGFGYSNLLANLEQRIAKSQVYVMTGTVEEIISEKPQLVVLDAGDGKTASPLKVMLENQSKTTWVQGERYTIYAEAFGLYDAYPRLVARYTYRPKK